MPVNTRSKERQFHKILWQEQNSFPDNYTGEHFLEALIVRADAPRSGYWRVVLASLPVIQQLCAEVILACSAYNLWKGTLHPLELLFWDTIALFTGAFILRYCNKKRGKALSKSWKQRLTAMIETGGVVMLTAVLAPVFATLTASISSDTILACASFLSIGQMYLRDYSGSEGFNRSITSCLSLACGMAASVLLSSQLEDTDAVFALMLLSLELYAVGPVFQNAINNTSITGRLVLVLCLASIAIFALSQLSVFLTTLLLCGIAFISLVCPMWLVRIHKFKAKVNGPWDEAMPKLLNTLKVS